MLVIPAAWGIWHVKFRGLQVGRAGIEVQVQSLATNADGAEILGIVLFGSGRDGALTCGSGDILGNGNVELVVCLLQDHRASLERLRNALIDREAFLGRNLIGRDGLRKRGRGKGRDRKQDFKGTHFRRCKFSDELQ